MPFGRSVMDLFPIWRSKVCQQCPIHATWSTSHIQDFESEPVDPVERYDRNEKPPGMLRGKQVGIASPRMVEQEL